MLTVATSASHLANFVIIIGLIGLIFNLSIPVISAHLFLIAVLTTIEVLNTHDESDELNRQRA